MTGFAPTICAKCRGEIEEAHPRAAIYGNKGKIERYYWREIFKTYCEYVLDWLKENSVPVTDVVEFRSRFPEKAKEFEKKAKKHWQDAHKSNPTYDLKERTDAEFLSKVKVPVNIIEAEYRQTEKNGQLLGKWLSRTGQMVSAEQVAAESYILRGYNVLTCERSLVSSWVATFLTQAIQDQSDPRLRETFRSSTRGWTSPNRNTPLINISLPEDFGSTEYFRRRKQHLEASIQQMRGANNLLMLFNELLHEGESLRDYLWVNDDKVVRSAQIALTIIPKELVVTSVEWAIKDFWHRQSGWPDLFVHKGSDFFFAEVKSPHDELSQEQMNWFERAAQCANIPCELCRIKRRPM